MSFYITQIMTNHVCFGRLLWRIGKKDSQACNFCDALEDNATYTLKFCRMWDAQRMQLRKSLGLGADFTLGEVVNAIIVIREAWIAFSAFAEEVMVKKEEEERHREMTGGPHLPLPSPSPSDQG